MSNFDKNLKAIDQVKRLTKEAKKFYGSSYNPSTLYPPRDPKFLLDEEYIPFDFENEPQNSSLYNEYMRVRTLKDPFEGTQEDVNISAQTTQMPDNEPYLEFDGSNLKWMEDGAEKYKWKAMSGSPDYQNRMYQARKGQGPLPEGEWNVRQSRAQHYDNASDFQKFVGRLGRGQWPNGTASWGNHRVWLDPSEDTYTYGRGGLAIHGGNSFGSNGCIDLENGMDDFNDKYSSYGKDMRLKVKYPNSF